MKNEHFVKARSRQGTKSLDLTIPVELIKKYSISSNDFFNVTIEKDGDNLKIIYSRIYSSNVI